MIGGPLAVLLAWATTAGAAGDVASAAPHPGMSPPQRARFETTLEGLRRRLKIPGLSAAIVSGGRLCWTRGFGLADVERGIAAGPDTPYHLASVTKPFAAVLLLQLAEEGVLSLEDPASAYELRYDDPGLVRVRHLLSHTSRGRPGEEFHYDSDRFADLGWVLARATGRSFRLLLHERILRPLAMEATAPTPLSMGDRFLSPFRIWLDPWHARVYRRLARPYALDRSFSVVESSYPIIFSPASGLISSVTDLARFDVALDEGRLLSEAARARMFAPTIASDGRELPYGLGWFTQSHAGTRLVWHYGWNPPSASALYLKLPDEGLTFIALANTDALSRPFDLGRADSQVLDSALALAFYETFVLEARRGRPLEPVDWEAGPASLLVRLRDPTEAAVAEMRERELLANRRMFHAVGREDRVDCLEAAYSRLHSGSTMKRGRDLPPLGEHLLPWPSIPLFGMTHVVALVWFLLVGLLTLAVWAIEAFRGRVRRRQKQPSEAPRGVPGGTATVLATAAVLAAVVFYAALLSRWPQDGDVTWSGGSPLARGLSGTAALAGALAILATLRTLASWRARTGSTLGGLARLLVATGVGAGAWAALDLAGWL